ncbi:hypothetical protein [Hoeflea prorocentri]|uniref:Uncharacterized protein n=1 Tax=Hoeflea prorocentri TaxID=1922333 RepID=A0A9X3UDT3_9HYPH|nr:hypothetical protein [Hoeflea prorocentri]MCY6379563.1 hypothetical protein [Hoeflea prorocentri]MDA5397363.1 hypothetical protein [Hoeflea prorocentri]
MSDHNVSMRYVENPDQSLTFQKSAGIGDRVGVRVTIAEKHIEKKRLTPDCQCMNGDGELAITGQAAVHAPERKTRRSPAAMAALFNEAMQ